MEATIWGLGFWIGLRVEGSGFRRWGLEFRVWHVAVYCPEPGPWQVYGLSRDFPTHHATPQQSDNPQTPNPQIPRRAGFRV